MAGQNRINCYVCDFRLPPRAMVRINGAENERKRQIAIQHRGNLGLVPGEIIDDSRICLNCNRRINEDIEVLTADGECLKLNVLTQTANSTCMFCDGANELRKLSIECRVKIFICKDIYVPESCRSCAHHFDENGNIPRILMEGLRFINRPYRLSGTQMQLFLHHLRESANNDESFDDIDSLSEAEFFHISPVTKEQFHDLYTYCDPVPEPNKNWSRHISKKELLVFLCKVRQGLSDDFLKVMFKYNSRQAVSTIISKVRRSLMLRFVPENIGLGAIGHEEYIDQHVTDFANALLNPNPNRRVAIVIVDGTYVPIEKPSDFEAFRDSFCMHKSRHLIKPVLLVAPDGYILDIQGPYFSDYYNNDASLLQNELEVNDETGFRRWVNDGDILVVDRGYRDVVPFLQNLGLVHKMPSLLAPGQRQLETEEANDSRLITKLRWFVEARNGHVKMIFKFFQRVVSSHHAVNVGDLYRIAGAIINKYRPLITMESATVELAQAMLEKSRMPNVVQIRVQAENLHTRNARWVTLNEAHALTFPRLNLDYLHELTVGVYQLNLAPGYIQDKLARDQMEVFEFDELVDEGGFIRVRIYSKHRRATKYQLWIAYTEEEISRHQEVENESNEDEYEPILGYYCTCRSGARTVGSCAHVASILWFLGYARHQPRVNYPSTALLENIADAAHRN